MNVQVERILQSLQVPYQNVSGTLRIQCPFHDDTNPSLQIDSEGSARCWVCETSIGFLPLLAKVLKVDLLEINARLVEEFGISLERTISRATIEQYHHAFSLQDTPHKQKMLQELYNRGMTLDLIKYYRIGYARNRVTIPIFNRLGWCVNVRYYLPGATNEVKVFSEYQYGDNVITPCEQMVYDKIVFCGGELKAYVGAYHLNAHGFGCVSGTTGEGNVESKWLPEFEGKTTWVCMDDDDKGRKATYEVCEWFHRYGIPTHAVYLDTGQKKGDLNDFVMAGGNLVEKIRAAEPYANEKELSAKEVTLSELLHEENTGRKVSFKGVISAVNSSPYRIPGIVEIICPKDNAICARCRKVRPSKTNLFQINTESPSILDLVESAGTNQQGCIQRAFEIPSKMSRMGIYSENVVLC